MTTQDGNTKVNFEDVFGGGNERREETNKYESGCFDASDL